jgi:hypothetical protein
MYNENDHVKDDEIGRTCSTHELRIMQAGLWRENNMKRAITTITFLFENNIKINRMDRIDMAPDKDLWRTLVKTAMNFGVP